MGISFRSYFTLSLFLYIRSIKHYIPQSHTFYNIWENTIENKYNFILFINLFGTLFFVFLRYFQDKIIGKINSAVYDEIKRIIVPKCIELILFFVLLPKTIGIDTFIFAFYTMISIFGTILFGRIKSLFDLASLPKGSTLNILFISVLLCLVINFNSFLYFSYYEEGKQRTFFKYYNDIPDSLLSIIYSRAYFFQVFFLSNIINNIESLFNFYNLLTNKDKETLSLLPISQIVHIALLIIQIIHIFFLLFHASFNKMEFKFYSIYSLLIIVFSLLKNLFLIGTIYLNIDLLNEKLPDATADDLIEEPNCLICRDQMLPGKCKKLPCGHCYHVECLEKWLRHSRECPMCHYDLSNLIDQDNENEKTQQQKEAEIMVNVRNQLSYSEKQHLEISPEIREIEFFQNLEDKLDIQSNENNQNESEVTNEENLS